MPLSPANEPSSRRPLPLLDLLTSPTAPGLALVAVLTPIAVKATLVFSPLPHWDLDPLVFSSPMTGAGPAGFALLDLLTILASAAALLVFVARARAGMTQVGVLGQLLLGLLTLAALATAIRWVLPTSSWFATAPTLHDSRIALSWIAAWAACCAMVTLSSIAEARRLAVYIIAGLLLVMIAKGAQQMLVEHPKLVESFKLDRVTILGAQGWAADSSSAKGYERRLMQNEPSGYFGLANIFATFAASGVGLCVPMLFGAMGTGGSRGARLGWGAMTLLCIGAVIAAGSKGGFVTAVAAAGVAIACLLIARRWVGSPTSKIESGGADAAANVPASGIARVMQAPLIALPMLMVIGAQAAIAVRGALGERFAELSVLFRSYYIEAAWRMLKAFPLWGVGPDGFKEYYLRYKNPLSPEEVASPHSIAWEWLATLGSAGLVATCGLMLSLVMIGLALARAVRPAAPGHESAACDRDSSAPDADQERVAVRLLCVPFVAILLAGAFAERFAMTPDNLVQRLAVPLVVALVMAVLMRGPQVVGPGREPKQHASTGRFEALGLGAAGVAVLLQSQIEVTLGAHQSASLGQAMVGLAAAGGMFRRSVSRATAPGTGTTAAQATPSPAEDYSRHARLVITPVAFLLIALATGGLWLPNVVRWEGRLNAAAEVVSPLSEADGLMRLHGERGDATALAEAAALLTRISGRPVATNPAAVAVAARQLQPKLIADAEQVLADAAALQPMDLGTLRERSRLLMLLAQMAMTRKDEASAAPLLVEAVKAPPKLLRARPATVNNWFVAGLQASHKIRPDPGTMHALQAKVAEAMTLDPYNVNTSLLEWQLFVAQPSPAETEAIEAAARTLRLNDNLRLDAEVKGLDARTIEQLRKYLADHRAG